MKRESVKSIPFTATCGGEEPRKHRCEQAEVDPALANAKNVPHHLDRDLGPASRALPRRYSCARVPGARRRLADHRGAGAAVRRRQVDTGGGHPAPSAQGRRLRVARRQRAGTPQAEPRSDQRDGGPADHWAERRGGGGDCRDGVAEYASGGGGEAGADGDSHGDGAGVGAGGGESGRGRTGEVGTVWRGVAEDPGGRG